MEGGVNVEIALSSYARRLEKLVIKSTKIVGVRLCKICLSTFCRLRRLKGHIWRQRAHLQEPQESLDSYGGIMERAREDSNLRPSDS